MPWIATHAEDYSESAAHAMVEAVQPYFSPLEQAYLGRHIDSISLKPMEGLGGYWKSSTREIVVSTTGEPTIMAMPQETRAQFSLAHELTHPLLALAEQDCRMNFFIINPDVRARAQAKARAFAPEAIAKIEAALDNRVGGEKIRFPEFTPEERVAAELYLRLDNRYYDLFGSTTYARFFGQGYTAPKRDHEVGCNVKALYATEEAITGKPASIVRELAGEILQLMDDKVGHSLQVNPNRPPKAEKSIPRGAGG